MIYIDQPKSYWRGKYWCHMIADNIEELHSFAKKIGMKREWFQDTKYPHYDVTVQRRKIAISLGAKEITTREIIKKSRENNAILEANQKEYKALENKLISLNTEDKQ